MKKATWLLIALALLSLRCGYRLSGLGRNLPPAARTVAIPDFKNQTSEPKADRFVSAAVREEFVRRSRLLLVEAQANPDMVLEGTIKTFESRPVSYSASGEVDRYEVLLTLDVRLIDMKNNEIFLQKNGLASQETYEADTEDFFSQEPASLDKIATRLASSIVVSILDNF